MDIMQLEGELLTGKVVRDAGKMIEVITPVFRACFSDTLGQAKDYKNDGKYRHTVSAVWNPARRDEPAFVNVNAILLPSIKKVAVANGVNFEMTNPLSTGKRRSTETGEYYVGYEEYSLWGTLSKYPKAENLKTSTVQCFNMQGQACPASNIYGGCYARAQIQIYMNSKKNLSLGIAWVQFAADGEPFSGETEYESVPAIPGAPAIGSPSESGGYKDF